MKRLFFLALGLAPILAVVPAAAHHSYTMFDMQKTVALDASVVRFKWQNPHAFIETDVAARGATERWAIEMTSPNNLAQEGWKRTSLKAGEQISVRIAPLRNGNTGGLFLDLRKPDGRVLDSGLPKNGTPVNVPQL